MTAVLVLLNVTSCASANSLHDDSHYVQRGPRTGYYIVRPGSALIHKLGIEGAPTSDTADPLRHGYGADALAFCFNRAGVLSAPPAYIVQEMPNDFYTRRLGSLIRGRSTRSRCRSILWATPERRETDLMGPSPATPSWFTIRLKIVPVAGDVDAKKATAIRRLGGTFSALTCGSTRADIDVARPERVRGSRRAAQNST